MLQVSLRAAWEAHRASVGPSLAAVQVVVNQVSAALTARRFRSGNYNRSHIFKCSCQHVGLAEKLPGRFATEHRAESQASS